MAYAETVETEPDALKKFILSFYYSTGGDVHFELLVEQVHYSFGG